MERYWAVALALVGWGILIFFLMRANRKEDLDPWRTAAERATKEGRPPPGAVGDPARICKHYREGGPSPCEWPYCSCTKGMKSK